MGIAEKVAKIRSQRSRLKIIARPDALSE